MRGCTRCGATYATGVLYCPRDGAATVEVSAADPVSPRAVPAAPAVLPPAAIPQQLAQPPAVSPPLGTQIARPVTSGDPFIGKMVGNFRLTRRIGAGGMGAVYEGVHPIVGIRVAVKLLGGSFALDRELVDRFFAEARTLNQVAHENIVRVIDLGVHQEGFYYSVMELLEGETLSAVLSRGRVELQRALGLLVQACEALAAAHEKGIVHRDLKPANIMLVRHPATGQELVKLVDFGIAKLHSAQPQGHATVSGTVIGTPAYMSPEQASGRVSEIDPRSDLYSLGLVAYELVTGRHPFEGRAVGELLVAQITELPPSPARLVPLPKRLDDALMRLLRKKRDERFPNATAAEAEFRQVLELLRSPPPAEPPRVPTPPVPASAPALPQVPPAPAPAAVSSPPPPRPAPLPSAPPSGPMFPPKREATMSPGGGVRLATRKPPRTGPSVRPLFVLALLVAGVVLGAVLVGAFDAEPLVSSAAVALGLVDEPHPTRVAPVVGDGTKEAFRVAPELASCQPLFTQLRALPVPAADAELEPRLRERLELHNKVVDCLSAEGKRVTGPAVWAAPYVEGVAAYNFVFALDRLSAPLRQKARTLQLPPAGREKDGIHPFFTELFLSQALDRFGAAMPDAPKEQQGWIARFENELELQRRRARMSEGAAAQ